jgi:uncharacterized NAD-dependent epimerase/dehydratase family protein
VLGFGGDIPVVATFDEGLALKPNALLIGIAPAGGQLPESWIQLLSSAIEHKIEIWNGLQRSSVKCPSWQRSRRSMA